MAGAIVGLQLLTTWIWSVPLATVNDVLAWMPVLIGVIACGAAVLVVLAFRFPPLLPFLLCAAGCGSAACNIAATPLWSESGAPGGWTMTVLGVVGTALSALQFRRTTRR